MPADPKRYNELRWQRIEGVPHGYRATALKTVPTRAGARGVVRSIGFAIIRPARDSGGLPNPASGQWLVIIDAFWCKPGQNAFDMTSVHPTLASAVARIEGRAGMYEWDVSDFPFQFS